LREKLDVVVGESGQKIEIVTTVYPIEKTGFQEDLFCQTKLFKALKGGNAHIKLML